MLFEGIQADRSRAMAEFIWRIKGHATKLWR
jgi:hypothetical protein